MPRRQGYVPSYRLHKPSGQARVILNGQHFYLGPYGSLESREKYSRLIAEMAGQANGAQKPAASATISALVEMSINELLLSYWTYAKAYYQKDGLPTKELGAMKDALRPLRQLYGHTPACEFGPKALKAIQQHWVQQKISRGVITGRGREATAGSCQARSVEALGPRGYRMPQNLLKAAWRWVKTTIAPRACLKRPSSTLSREVPSTRRFCALEGMPRIAARWATMLPEILVFKARLCAGAMARRAR